jgi:putative flippase GtrA
MRIPTLYFIYESLFHPHKNETIEAQFIRQILSGTATTLVDLISFYLSIKLGIHPMLAAILSFILAVSTNFTIGKFYVIGGVTKQKKKTLSQFILYTIYALISLGIVQFFLLLFHIFMNFDPLYVKIASVPIVFVWTLIVTRYLVFDKKDIKMVSIDKEDASSTR